jgi:hypothetical protein
MALRRASNDFLNYQGGFQDGLPNVFPGVRITRLGRYDTSLFDAYAGIAVLDFLHGDKPRLVSVHMPHSCNIVSLSSRTLSHNVHM